MRTNKSLRTFCISASVIAIALSVGCAGTSTKHSHSGPVVLGSTKSFVPYGFGWGTVAPRTLYNGGDPSGRVSKIHWQAWGRSVALGSGLTSLAPTRSE